MRDLAYIMARIDAAESGIFITALADLPHQVATEIAATGAPLIHVGHDQDADRVIEEALIAAGITPRHTLAAGLAELSDALQRPIVLLIEAVERYATEICFTRSRRHEMN